MKSRLLNLAAAVSLLLAIVIVAQWVRSYGRHEVITRTWHASNEEHRWTVDLEYSWLDFRIMHRIVPGRPLADGYAYVDETQHDQSMNISTNVSTRWFSFPPIDYMRSLLPRYGFDERQFAVADWLLLLPTLPLPLIAIVRHRRRRHRERNNLCPTCGYDLRATPDAGGARFDRCPECGAVPASSLVREQSA